MSDKVKGIEQAARIVEAHMAGQSENVVMQLKEAAKAIRNLSVTSEGYEESAEIVETCALGQPEAISSLMADIAQKVRDRFVAEERE